jgi:uncharacterized integral membrane protein
MTAEEREWYERHPQERKRLQKRARPHWWMWASFLVTLVLLVLALVAAVAVVVLALAALGV